MISEECLEEANQKLKQSTDAPDRTRKAVAREMCRLLESGQLKEDIDRESPDLDYLLSRLEIREGKDNPTLDMKWNHWLGQIDFFENGYDRYKV
ncbi:hypothetical protein GOC74_08650 [Halomicrobium mukohataei]|uniref:Uncharacterized protein n=1 Tax=Halomicrobium mukohataei TaxID=57705 RepID=A0A847UFZ5_9EURY|nr:hypothetical protein [Halomicrobium mukohataei]NLV09998.1 hypothetical protein [Halomicrobium mukohataei]